MSDTQIRGQILEQFEDEIDDQDDARTEAKGGQPQQANQNVVVNFKLSEERVKAKKDAAKERRNMIRDRLRGSGIAK